MGAGRSANSPRRFVAAFLLLVLVPSALLVALGWRLYWQERKAALQEFDLRRRQAADSLVQSLELSLAATERALLARSPNAAQLADAAVVHFSTNGEAIAPAGVPFVRTPSPGATTGAAAEAVAGRHVHSADHQVSVGRVETVAELR